MPTTIYDWQVPKYRANEFAAKQSKYCVCVFVINEGEKLLKQLAQMQYLNSNIDTIIADGGSNDNSTSPDTLIKLGINTLLVKEDSGKLGSQMRMAYAWALKRGYKGVISIDGNNKDSVENIPDFIEKLEQGYDHIQGSRFIPGGKQINTPLSRLIGLKLLHIPVMRIASGFNYTDTTNGFRAYSEKLLRSNKLSIFRDVFTGYELHYYLAVKAPSNDFKCTEIPVLRSYPATGKTPTKISPLQGNIEVVLKLLKVAFGFYNTNSKPANSKKK